MTAPLHILPAQKEARIHAELSDWKAIVAPYQIADPRAAAWQLLNTLGPLLLLWVGMYVAYDYSGWLVAALAVPTSFLLTRTFIIQHDCGHASFLKSRRRMDAIGWGLSLLTSVPYTYWSRVHSFHHGHVGQLEHRNVGDINFLTVDEYRARSPWGRLRYRIFRSPLVITLVAPLAYIVVMCRIPKVGYAGWGPVHRKLHLNNLAIVGAYALLGFCFGWTRLLVVQGSVVLGFATIAFWFFYVQHQHEETYMRWDGNWDYLLAAIKGATLYALHPVFHWLTGNIGYHHIHHLSSRIPNYHLAKCARENPILQKFVTAVTFRESLSMIGNKLWCERRGRMVTFGEYARMG